MYTKFTDLYFGGYGYTKTKYDIIYIELDIKKAIEYFESKFGVYAEAFFIEETISTCNDDGVDNFILIISKQEIRNDILNKLLDE